ncbi:MAG: molybdopterin-guanine dinucleotide biosynthesis protein B [Syntrophobacterales bacterium]|nr:MAG: molybdopterin-guanine dinucleotide biosynthesis protein B [Syntrophobacterales bacterium]
MIPIISIVGKSNSGKTTLIEKIVPELMRRGYRVTTVKHDFHGFEIDKEGKDSWRHKRAGAHGVIISSPQKVALIRDVDRDMSLEELRDSFGGDADLILSEGFKSDVQPKVEVFRKEEHGELLCTKEDNLVAIASNRPFDIGIPCLDIDDVKGIVDLIESKFLKGGRREDIALSINGKRISLSPFVKRFLMRSIKGMVSCLKGAENPKRIEIKID